MVVAVTVTVAKTVVTLFVPWRSSTATEKSPRKAPRGVPGGVACEEDFAANDHGFAKWQ